MTGTKLTCSFGLIVWLEDTAHQRADEDAGRPANSSLPRVALI